MQQTDVLIIGSGVAALLAAWRLSQEGTEVTLLPGPKNFNTLSEPSLLQTDGLLYIEEGKETIWQEKLAADPARCPRAVDHLMQNAQRLTHLLQRELDLSLEVGKNKALPSLIDSSDKALSDKAVSETILSETVLSETVLSCQDHTQRDLFAALKAKVEQAANIVVRSEPVVELITLDHSSKGGDAFKKGACCGAYLLQEKEEGKEIIPLFAKEIVIADSYFHHLFPCAQLNLDEVGHGLNLAYRAGARLMHLDRLFFHPLALALPLEQALLLPLKWLWQGAILLNGEGLPLFKGGISQELQQQPWLVAKEMYRELLLRGSDHLWVDLSAIDQASLEASFPSIMTYLKNNGFTQLSDPLPVAPLLQNPLGGIAVDRLGLSTVQRLRAIGPGAVTGLQGLSPNPSLSLLEHLVWALTTAEDIAKQIKKFAYYFPPLKSLSFKSEGQGAPILHALELKTDSLEDTRLLSLMRQLMWHSFSFSPSSAKTIAMGPLRALNDHVEQHFWSKDLSHSSILLRSAATASLLIAQAILNQD